MPSITLDVLFIERHVSLVVCVRARTGERYSVGMKWRKLERDSSRVEEVNALRKEDCVIRKRKLVYVSEIRDIPRAPVER